MLKWLAIHVTAESMKPETLISMKHSVTCQILGWNEAIYQIVADRRAVLCDGRHWRIGRHYRRREEKRHEAVKNCACRNRNGEDMEKYLAETNMKYIGGGWCLAARHRELTQKQEYLQAENMARLWRGCARLAAAKQAACLAAAWPVASWNRLKQPGEAGNTICPSLQSPVSMAREKLSENSTDWWSSASKSYD